MLYQLLSYIHRYLDVACTLRDFETWLFSNLQRILDSGDDKVIETANQIDADLVELGEDLIDEATFRERLEGYVSACETVPFVFSETERTTVADATAAVETFNDQLVIPGLVEDHRLGRIVV